MNQLIFIRELLYELKRDYGVPVEFFRDRSSSTNLQTGLKVVDKYNFIIQKVIKINSNAIRDAIYNAAFTQADRNFTYGATFDKTTERLIVDSRDIVNNFMFELEDYATIGNNRYIVKSIESLRSNAGYILTVNSIEGDENDRIEIQCITSGINFCEILKGVI